MTKRSFRTIASSFVGLTTMFVGLALFHEVPVEASQCCQVCEAQESACYSECTSMSHNTGPGDSLSACYNGCDTALYNGVYACWAHCYYCSPTPNPPQCYTLYNWHYQECTAHDGNGNCTAWTDVEHGYYTFASSSQFCTS